MQMLKGLLRLSVSAVLERVNITIWNGTTMENAQSRYISLETVPVTRVMYQPHIEQHSRIRMTEVTVITSE